MSPPCNQPCYGGRYAAAVAQNIKVARGAIDKALEDQKLDALFAPAGPPAWEIVPFPGGGGDKHGAGFFTCTSMAAVAGYPIITVPAGDWLGMPIGIAFVGGRFSDKRLLEVCIGHISPFISPFVSPGSRLRLGWILAASGRWRTATRPSPRRGSHPSSRPRSMSRRSFATRPRRRRREAATAAPASTYSRRQRRQRR